jgi:hypothetical protein
MKKRLIWGLCILLFTSCNKSNTGNVNEGPLTGKWIVKGTNGSGPGGTLDFSTTIPQTSFLKFDCTGSPGPQTWPAIVETPYKFQDNNLFYNDYVNPANGLYNVESFKWIKYGEEFTVKFYEIVRYVATDYYVNYVKIK